MGRPRESGAGLPPGLYWSEAEGFRLRMPDGKKRRLGKMPDEEARKLWAKTWALEIEPAQAGTFAEIIDAYRRLRLPLVPAERTREGYDAGLDRLRKRWGKLPYAKTEAERIRRPECIGPGLFTRYLEDAAAKPRGLSAARHDVRLASVVFSWAMGRELTYFHPVKAVRIGKSPPRRVTVTDEQRAAVLAHLPPAVALMVRLGALIGVRATDLRMMQRGQIRDDVLVVRPHKTAKTGHQQHWEITPGVRAILDEAKRLRGAVRSLCVFPNRKGTPYTEQSLSRAFTRAAQKAKVPVQFRDLRKTAINAAKAKGDNASDFAGHQDPRTTRAHYEVEPVKVRPLDAGTAPLPVDGDAASA